MEDPRIESAWDPSARVVVAACRECPEFRFGSPNHDAVESAVELHLAFHRFADAKCAPLLAEIERLTHEGRCAGCGEDGAVFCRWCDGD